MFGLDEGEGECKLSDDFDDEDEDALVETEIVHNITRNDEGQQEDEQDGNG